MKFTNSIFVFGAGVILIPASGAFAAGDIAKGKRLAKRKCAVCHTMHKGGERRLGPNLYNVLGRPAASVNKIPIFESHGGIGNRLGRGGLHRVSDQTGKFVKGTKMSFGGLKKATQRADMLAYFRTLTEAAPQPTGAGNAARGKAVAVRQCQICHSFNKGGKMVLGPNLYGIFGKPAGAVKGYKYSKALLASGLTWTDAKPYRISRRSGAIYQRNKSEVPWD